MSEIHWENVTFITCPPPPIPRNANSEQNFSAKQNTEKAKTNICSDKMSNSDVVYEAIPFWLTATKLN
jgi:hypothetical protein